MKIDAGGRASGRGRRKRTRSKEQGMPVEIWVIAAAVLGLAWAGSRYLACWPARDHGEEEISTEQIDMAIAFYKKELLGTLEIVSGEAMNEDPRMFINEIPRAIQILVHIEDLYRRKGVAFDARGIHRLFCEVESIVSDTEKRGAEGGKGAGNTRFSEVRNRIRCFVTCGMP